MNEQPNNQNVKSSSHVSLPILSCAQHLRSLSLVVSLSLSRARTLSPPPLTPSWLPYCTATWLTCLAKACSLRERQKTRNSQNNTRVPEWKKRGDRGSSHLLHTPQLCKQPHTSHKTMPHNCVLASNRPTACHQPSVPKENSGSFLELFSSFKLSKICARASYFFLIFI